MLVVLAGGSLLVSAEDRASLKRARREIARLQSELARIKSEYNFTLSRINEKHQAELEKLMSWNGPLREGEFSDNEGNYHDQ
ncbi:MAG: host-nuclease inhibitor Gam family protein [Candidatus Thiodiazotropha sp. (ex Lucina pensylvanica)]|nr:host-nuclease inhibitor Gam family protein [Candidatus Thiodiazotropha sp. (ex Lucina pensylvanica)]MBT3033283.1 host-nuclease inhibitor Gam family protein [Candidatus Thiodiazotropha sp. (ex Lucina pensylvanica)]MBT3050968.1 host-nuclease inhibitor Gam family protein [Candidatus Thiodiazotropha sp. (ex Codakia orbicularis)]MBV2100958.1 host-nuclease inhibitor Gam family protein [Candidatus Thiodiazotropha sp. (ex Codakia orbicularis)]MBV2119502.1 host-nuclease inhibitor Gam family protein [